LLHIKLKVQVWLLSSILSKESLRTAEKRWSSRLKFRWAV